MVDIMRSLLHYGFTRHGVITIIDTEEGRAYRQTTLMEYMVEVKHSASLKRLRLRWKVPPPAAYRDVNKHDLKRRRLNSKTPEPEAYRVVDLTE